jgi:chromosome segregation ATPase
MEIGYYINTYSEEIKDIEIEIKDYQKTLATITQEIKELPDEIQQYIDIVESDTEKLGTVTEQIKVLNNKLIPKQNEYIEIKNSLQEKETEKEDNLTEQNNLTKIYKTELADLGAKQCEYVKTELVQMDKVKTTDWRSELYLQGAATEPLGLESNYYYAELSAE